MRPRSALQLAQTELFRAQIEYSVGDAYTMMALSFRKMISGHVQGPYGEPYDIINNTNNTCLHWDYKEKSNMDGGSSNGSSI